MPDMNTALHAQERNDVSSCGTVNKASMADRKSLTVWLRFSECGADYARCNICDVKCKTSGRNTSNLRKHLVKHNIFFKVEERQFLTASDLRLQLLHSAASTRLHPLATRRLQPATWEKKCLKQLRCYNTNS
ncbi:hypothetical protein GOODEAATRI_025737 [Goodea atripinnis]|uniref:BED-type domain-containing protein n=1 Tax=Goodea atripinnis TaxID=208336 RepID=A0ABV0NDL8_9TELE